MTRQTSKGRCTFCHRELSKAFDKRTSVTGRQVRPVLLLIHTPTRLYVTTSFCLYRILLLTKSVQPAEEEVYAETDLKRKVYLLS